ncbi:hypothetical protein FA95DRAFT_1658834 [Auriscalpium vulgare]|uniref:Uncharacterized protein n=1 Tax=Auriscalpium vulgare TaxID=40419 RepID=A0ACB8R5C8_9AGAM|nr:hypothetical protein FA95DRAFT_1658834 [Auriscalpium vulgare]
MTRTRKSQRVVSDDDEENQPAENSEGAPVKKQKAQHKPASPEADGGEEREAMPSRHVRRQENQQNVASLTFLSIPDLTVDANSEPSSQGVSSAAGESAQAVASAPLVHGNDSSTAHKSKPTASAQSFARDDLFGESSENDSEGTDQEPEKDEQWVPDDEPEGAGGEGASKAARTINAQFKKAVPQWDSTDAEPVTLDAEQRELMRAVDKHLNFTDLDNPAPAPETTTVRSSAPRSKATSTSARSKGKGAAVPQTATLNNGRVGVAPEARPFSSFILLTLASKPRNNDGRAGAPRVVEVSDGSEDEGHANSNGRRSSDGQPRASHVRVPPSVDTSPAALEAEERLHVDARGIQSKANTPGMGASADRGGKWPAWTNVVPPEKGRRMTMGDQTQQVQAVLKRTCAKEVPRILCFRNTYPSDGARTFYLIDGLKNAARALGYSDILARLEQEPAYHELLIKIPEARISIFRGDVKRGADDTVKRAYHLNRIPDAVYVKNMKRVLTEGLNGRLYVFPADISKMTFDTSSPFCHKAITDILHDKFFGARAVHRFPTADYKAVSPKGDTPVIPPVMLALVATIIDAGLVSHSLSPGAATKVDFHADKFKVVYEEHIHRLRRLKKRSESGFWGLLGLLYSKASKGSADPDTLEPPLESDGDDNDDDDDDDVVDNDGFAANFAR